MLSCYGVVQSLVKVSGRFVLLSVVRDKAEKIGSAHASGQRDSRWHGA